MVGLQRIVHLHTYQISYISWKNYFTFSHKRNCTFLLNLELYFWSCWGKTFANLSLLRNSKALYLFILRVAYISSRILLRCYISSNIYVHRYSIFISLLRYLFYSVGKMTKQIRHHLIMDVPLTENMCYIAVLGYSNIFASAPMLWNWTQMA